MNLLDWKVKQSWRGEKRQKTEVAINCNFIYDKQVASCVKYSSQRNQGANVLTAEYPPCGFTNSSAPFKTAVWDMTEKPDNRFKN